MLIQLTRFFGKSPLPSLCDKKKNVPYCIARALTNAKKGNFKDGFAFTGANAYRVDKIISVKELIDTLVAEYQEVVIKRSSEALMATEKA